MTISDTAIGPLAVPAERGGKDGDGRIFGSIQAAPRRGRTVTRTARLCSIASHDFSSWDTYPSPVPEARLKSHGSLKDRRSPEPCKTVETIAGERAINDVS